MKVFRIVADVNNFQGLALEDSRIWRTGRLVFDGATKLVDWSPPSIFALHPTLRKGNVSDICPGAIVLDSIACEALADLIEMCAELLPIGEGPLVEHVLNVTECINVLDESSTTWIYGKSTGAKLRIEKYMFHSSRFTEVPLFKIPETAKSEILTVAGLKDPEDEFKSRVESAGLTGLIFEELWSDEEFVG